jgi:hypothetical protein
VVCKVIDYNAVAMDTCSGDNRELVFQFYNVNNGVFSSYFVNVDLLTHLMKFQTGNT